ncbi:hypothetical protein Tco_0598256 [Tanacetum coccineum]
MRENDKEEKFKHDMDEIETINIELEHSVAKLLSENERLHKEIEHLKKIYKDQFDSIKKTRALSKEHGDSLIAQLNFKSLENVDLKRQIQDKDPKTQICTQFLLMTERERLSILSLLSKASRLSSWLMAPSGYRISTSLILNKLARTVLARGIRKAERARESRNSTVSACALGQKKRRRERGSTDPDIY